MSLVTLVSGGLDSLLMAALAKEEGTEQHPLFVNYGQLALERELRSCRAGLNSLQLPPPTVANLSGYATVADSGLTNPMLDVVRDAFTPGRNLLFLLAAAAHAWTRRADSIAIGLLREDAALFPDQTSAFLHQAEALLSAALGKSLKVIAPLMDCTKEDVVALASARQITGTYSCHVGGSTPCGECIACKEFQFFKEV